jgi:hypothetical protein
LYKFACNGKCLPEINAVGKARGFPRLVSDWTEEQVAAALAELTTADNGQAR